MNALPDNPAGWILQEKLDGVFCRWTGSAFLSRNGHRFTPPGWWFVGMPPQPMDGELYAGRGGFDFLVSTIQRRKSDWVGVSYRPFDLPVLRVPIERRIAMLAGLTMPPHCLPVPSRLCASAADLGRTEAATVAAGGEGLVLREPGSHYRPGGFVKVKRLFPDLNRSALD